MKNKTKLISSIILVLLSINLVLAFGVGGGGIIQKIMPGETGEIELFVQNMVGDEDYVTQVTIEVGSEYASIEKDEYEIPAHSGLFIPVTITIPEDTEIGTRLPLTVVFSLGSSGGVFGQQIVVSPTIVAGEQETAIPNIMPTPPPKIVEKPMNKNLVIVIVLVVILLLAIIIKKIKK